MVLYSCNEIDQLIARYVESGGNVLEMREGVLGRGDLLLYGPENLRTIVVREIALNEWSSAHTVRTYKNCPKKYQTMIDEMEDAI